MKNEQEKNRRELLARIVPRVLDGVETLPDAVAAVKRLGGLRRVLAFAVGVLSQTDAYNEKIALLLDAVPPISWTTSRCTFRGFIGILLYLRAKDRLPFRHKHLLEEYFEESLDFYLSSAYEFIGVNDNTPAMIMTYLFLYGESFGNTSALSCAERRLSDFERLLEDRDCPSEYHSPTYLGITIHSLAVLANLSRDADIRARARRCEGALWHTAMQVFDRRAGTIMGPYSRAYENGVRGETTQMRLLYDILLGERLPIRPFLNDSYPLCREGELLAEGAMLTAEEYHCSAASVRHALERPYPYSVHLLAESSPSADTYLIPDCPESDAERVALSTAPLLHSEELFEYAPGVTHLFTSFHDGYALGTASRDWHNGLQADGFFAMVKRPIVRTQKDISTVFSSLSLNERGLDAPDLTDMGRKVAFQSDHTAMVLYSPKCIDEDVTSIALRVFISNPSPAILEMRCGLRPLRVGDSFPLPREPLCFSFGNVYAALLPLADECTVRIESVRDCLAVSMVAYEGEGQHMTRKEMKLMKMGFLFTLANREEAGSFDLFCRDVGDYRLKDELDANLHTRFAFERRVRYETASGESLACAYSPVTEGVRYMRASGKCLV